MNSVRIARSVVLVTSLTSLAASAAFAQGPSSPPVASGSQEGFVLQSPDGANRLALGLTAQTDGRFSVPASGPGKI